MATINIHSLNHLFLNLDDAIPTQEFVSAREPQAPSKAGLARRMEQDFPAD